MGLGDNPDQPLRVSEGPIYEAGVVANGGDAVFYLLGHTPEQREDIYVLLVDGQSVLRFELERNDAKPAPREIEHFSLTDYKRGLTGLAARDLAAAMAAVSA